jgi:hypothetical protein
MPVKRQTLDPIPQNYTNTATDNTDATFLGGQTNYTLVTPTNVTPVTRRTIVNMADIPDPGEAQQLPGEEGGGL